MSDPNRMIADLSAGEQRALLAQLLKKRNREFPLSAGQQALWFLHQLAPGEVAYNIMLSLAVRRPLDVAALRRAFQELVNRHPSLRATFHARDGRPVQRVHERAEVSFVVAEAAGWGDERLNRRLAEEADLPFDLEAGPLLRVSLFVRSESDYVLAIFVHHIVSDLQSLDLLVNELRALYGAEVSRRPAPIPPPARQYADYVRWQNEMLAGPVGERLWAYWQDQLAGELPSLSLPTDRPRPPVQSHRGDRYEFAFGKELSERLRFFARAEGATLYMTLLSAFLVLLHRYSGQSEVLVGSPAAGRNQDLFRGIVGYFVNPVVLRSDFTGDPSFRDVLARTRQTVLAALEHQDYPFPQLVERLGAAHDPSRPPVFQVAFDWVKMAAPAGESALDFEVLAAEQRGAPFELALIVIEAEQSLSASINYNTDLFEAGTVERMCGHLEQLLTEALDRPDLPVSRLGLLPEAERRLLLRDWNRTDGPFPSGLALHDLFERQAAARPEAEAVRCEGRVMSYGELNERANRLAHLLRGLGVGRGALVGVVMERGLELAAGLMGVLKSGAAYVPLEPGLPEARLGWVLKALGVRVVLTQAGQVSRLARLSEELTDLRHLVCLDPEGSSCAREELAAPLRVWAAENLARQPGHDPQATAGPEDLAYVIFTSGSSGTPKGVMVRHRPAVNLVDWVNSSFAVGPADRLLWVTSPGFDLSVYDLFGMLAAGGSVRLASRAELDEPRLLAEVLRTGGITFWDSAPAALQQLMPFLGAGQGAGGELRLAFVSGDWVPVSLPGRVRESFAGARVVALGGATEATVWSNYYEVGEVGAGWASIPYGRPIRNARYYVLGSGLEPCPVGVAGELYIGGGCLAEGYLGEPGLTAEKFVPDPFGGERGGRLYRTGDRARYWADGNIEFLGRADEQVKIRGYRVEPGEVEAALGLHAAVRECAVVARGEASEKRLVAYVVAREGMKAEGGELREHLRGLVPEYMVPGAWVFLERIPLSSNGKVDRRALPEPEREAAGRAYVAPRGAIEELLAGIWAEVLGLDRVSVEENFFELGGHSLLATQVVARAREAFGVELALRTLFESPTVADLARELEAALQSGQAAPASPVVPVARDKELPLSFAQQRLWFLDQLEPGSPSYNMPGAVRLTGALDVTAFESALKEMTRRHEILRTTFKDVDGRPTQVIAPESDFSLRREDLSHLGVAECEEEVRRRAASEARRPFDLARGPLLRILLLRLGAEEHVALVTMHHIVSDGWSLKVLVSEVAALYQAFADGNPSPLPEPTIQYADFAAWQRMRLQGETLEMQLAYWRRQLAGAPAALNLPTDRPRPPVQIYRGARLPLSLSEGLAESVKRFSRREGATTFMTLLATFSALLGRYSGQDDVCVGTPVAGRTRAEVEGLIGFFVNTLVVRTDLSGDPSFRELLKRVRETALGAYAHQDVPFEQLVDELQPERDLSRSPLFQVMLFENSTPEAVSFGEVTLTTLELGSGTAKFDLNLGLEEKAGRLTGWLEYNTDLFEAGTVERMCGHLEQLLTEALDRPDLPVSRLGLLPEAERRLLLRDWNRTDGPFPSSLALHDLFERQAAARPEAEAVRCEGRVMSYGELNERANRLAHLLRGLGVGRGALVGVVMERGLELAAGLMGVLKSGAAYVPLEPGLPEARLGWVLKALGVRVVLTQAGQVSRLAGLGDQLPDLRHLVCLDPEDVSPPDLGPLPASWRVWGAADLLRSSEMNLEGAAGPEDLAYVIFTSGSSGTPKGVMVRHRPAVNLVDWVNSSFAVGPADRLLWVTSPGFDLSVYDLFGMLAAGGSVRLASRAELDEPRLLAEVLRTGGITFWDSAPAALQQLMPFLGAGQGAGGELRLAFVSGDWVPVSLPGRVRESFAGARVVALGGATEATVWSNYYEVGEVGAGWASIPYGRPIRNARYYVLGSGLEPCPVGVAGELYIGGGCLAEGYLGEPGLTAEKFVPDPFGGERGGRLYRTGDRARYWADGNIEFLGRADEQVKIRGYRVEPGEVEAALGLHAAVRECAVVARGEASEKRLVAYVVAREGMKAEGGELREHLRGLVPEYMVPGAWVFLERIPLSSNGKVDRRALPEPDQDSRRAGRAYIAARNTMEAALAAIWGEVLGLDRVSVEENFFELGGHSLLATQVVARAREAFGVELPLRSLFESPTVAGFAGCIALAKERRRDVPPLRRVERGEGMALSYAQQRLWFLSRLDPQSPLYHIPAAVRLRGPLDRRALERALAEVVDRHQALRTAFVSEAGLTRQVLRPAPEPGLELSDLGHLPEAEREEGLRRLAREEARRPFDLGRGPMLRAQLVRLGEEEHALLLTLHHIAADGWSVGVLIRELGALYAAYAGGGESPLGELAVQYVDYAVWQREWLEGGELERQLGYWRRQLAGAPGALELPTDRPRPAAQSFRGATLTAVLPPSLTEALKTLSEREGATLFMTMLAALKALLFRWAGQDDIVVGTVSANRNERELEDLIGCFMNFLALRSKVVGEETARELLGRVRATVLEAFAWQDCPFDKVVEAVNPERRQNQNPLYNVAFLMQNYPTGPLFGGALEATILPPEIETALLDLRLVAEESPDGLHLWCEYSTDLFKAETLEHFLDSYRAVLEQFVQQPETAISAIQLSAGLEARARVQEEALTIAVAASFTAEPVETTLTYWMGELGLRAGIEFAPYHQEFQQLLNPASLLSRNQSGVNVLLVRLEDWGRQAEVAGARLDLSPADCEQIEGQASEFVSAVKAAAARSTVPYLICLCPASPALTARPTLADFFARLEALFAAELADVASVFLVPSAELASTYPVPDYYDAHGDRHGHVPYRPVFFAALATMIARKVLALRREPYKVVVLDCDGSLWDGVCGEDGALGVEVDAPRRALQEFMAAQHEAGMLVCLCSKNNEADVSEVFRRHPGMVLKEVQIARRRINWDAKSENLRSLAAELRLGLESFIVIDDSPVECAEIRAHCPEALTLQLPEEPEKFLRFLQHTWAFDRLKVSAEDGKRTAFYHEDARRERLRAESLTFADFLANLGLDVRLSGMEPGQAARVAQLTQRVNQFNLTGARRAEGEISNLCQAGERECLVVQVSDRFGDYGLVGALIFVGGPEALTVEMLLLSCRVLGRGVEHRLVARLGEIARGRGLDRVDLRFRVTGRNQPAHDFLRSIGAESRQLSDDEWSFALSSHCAAALTYRPPQPA